MRALVLAALAMVSIVASAVTPQRALPQPEPAVAFDNLSAIATWLRHHGREGYIGGDVADAMGIPRGGEAMLSAWQRGFRTDDVLRIAQISTDEELDFILFMVQRPDDQVYFYLATPLGGLQKAFVSIPSKNVVRPLGRAEAELRWLEEVLYWKDRAEAR
jgi:hypothetical protein